MNKNSEIIHNQSKKLCYECEKKKNNPTSNAKDNNNNMLWLLNTSHFVQVDYIAWKAD